MKYSKIKADLLAAGYTLETEKKIDGTRNRYAAFTATVYSSDYIMRFEFIISAGALFRAWIDGDEIPPAYVPGKIPAPGVIQRGAVTWGCGV